MKKLVLFSLIVAIASQVTGCIISSGDDDDGGGGGTITAHWDIKSISGANVGCPSGFDTAALYSQQVDANYANIGAPVVDLFDCTAFTAVSAPLNATTYYSWIQIESHDGSQTYASTVEAYVDLTTTDATFSADILSDGGYFQMAWTLTQGGAPTSCAANPDVAGVEAISTEVSNPSNAASDIFHCGDHYGVTAGLPSGTYTVHVDAIDNETPPKSLGDAPDLTNKVVGDQNQVTNLGTISIPLD